MAKVISSARPYQVELLKKCVSQNAIIKLGTGAGKTFIAVMLMKEFGKHLKSGKKIIFLVNSVPLVSQQSLFIERNTPLRVNKYCGADGVDDFTEEQWNDEFSKYDVMVMVQHCFLDVLNHGFFKITDVCLIIFDECHHCAKNHPYNQIMQHQYHRTKSHNLPVPHILGLSASLITKKATSYKFLALKKELEEALDAKVVTTENLNSVLKFQTQPDESVLTYELPPLSGTMAAILNEAQEKLTELRDERFQELRTEYGDVIRRKVAEDEEGKTYKKAQRLLAQLDRIITNLGIFCTIEVINFLVDELQDISTETPYAKRISDTTMDALSKVRAECSRLLGDHRRRNDFDKMIKFSTNKMHVLLTILNDYFEGTEDLDDDSLVTPNKNSAIIFVKERSTASVVSQFLKKFAGLQKTQLKNLKADFVTGGLMTDRINKVKFSPRKQDADAETKRMQAVLKDFQKGTVNCLVATSVVEEGLDVKGCNLVVRFDEIDNVRSYIQSKGRARAKPSKFIIMVQEGLKAQKLESDLRGFRQIEEMDIDACHKLMTNDDEEEEEDEEEMFFVDPNDPLSPRVSSTGAITLLHQYIQSIPTDRFTKLAPVYEYEEVTGLTCHNGFFKALMVAGNNNMAPCGPVTCTLHLPPVIPLQSPIQSDSMKTRKGAKRNVALKTVKKLYSMGELDSNLMPRRRDAEWDDEVEADGEADMKNAGTKKARRFYGVKVSPELQLDTTRTSFIVYQICLTLVEMAPNPKNYKIYAPESISRTLALILSEPLPSEVLGFDLFTVSGKMRVQLERQTDLRLTAAQRKRIRQFQRFAFIEVGFAKDWMEEREQGDPMVCLYQNGSIDWHSMASVLENKNHDNDQQTAFTFRASDFEDAVVIPKHKPEERFFVEEMVPELSPASLMPNHATTTFATHFETQYRLPTTTCSQPLLRISNANRKHHMLKPIAVAGGSKTKKSRAGFLSDRPLYIPELVDIHVIPASVWREFQIFPFVLHRLDHLLKTTHFGKRILESTGLDTDIVAEPKQSAVEFTHLLVSRPLGPISPFDLLQALTLSDADDMFDLERFEVLGDSFLKAAVSVQLYFTKKEALNEGHLTQMRSRIVGNKNLYNLAIHNDVPFLVSSTKFRPHLNWSPPGTREPEHLDRVLREWDERFREAKAEAKEANPADRFHSLIEQTDLDQLISDPPSTASAKDEVFKRLLRKQTKDFKPSDLDLQFRSSRLIGDKSLADCVEAIIGCFLVKCGPRPTLLVMRHLGLSVMPSADPSSTDWFSPPENALIEQSRDPQGLYDVINVGQVEGKIGYTFNEKSFLLQAMTHPSYYSNRCTQSYERLEFLGDAVIDYLVTCHLYCGETMNPGMITDLRSAVVNNEMFGTLVVQAGLHRNLLHHSPDLLRIIDDFVVTVTDVDETDDVPPLSPLLCGLDVTGDNGLAGLDDVDCPKVLGDIFESLMGAVFLDSGFDFLEVWCCFRRLFPDLDSVIARRPRNPVAVLTEHFPERTTFESTSSPGEVIVTVDVSDERKVRFRGKGANKKAAKRAAAKCAVKELKKRKMW